MQANSWFRWIATVTLGLSLMACSTLPGRTAKPLAQAELFFDVYAERTDFERFMAFYADDAILEDLIYGHIAQGKSEIRAFLNWNDGKFALSNGATAMRVNKLHADGRYVYAQGVFNAFSYSGKPHGPWRFLIALEFNREGQIIRHIDWINYTPRESFLGGKNLNESPLAE